MKNVIKHSKKGILMVTLFATLLSSANEATFFNVKNEVRTTSLTLNNVKEGNLLSIKDDNGVTLYKELIHKPGIYTKGFDLTELPNGSYIFELDKDVEIKIIPFSVKAGTVLFNNEEELIIFKPFVRLNGDLAFLTKLSINEAPLKIEIFFTDSNEYTLVYSEKIENTAEIKRIFKLNGLKNGSYKMVFHSEDREFTKFINQKPILL